MIKVFVLLAHVLFMNGDTDDMTRSATFPTEAACVMFMMNDADKEFRDHVADVKEVTFACKPLLVKDNSI